MSNHLEAPAEVRAAAPRQGRHAGTTRPDRRRPCGGRWERSPISADGSLRTMLTPARFIDGFEQVDGVHPGFRRNHAKGVGVSGFFESNGNGVRLSKAAVFRPGRVPVIGRFSLAGGQPDAADTPDAVRGLGLQFSLPDGELWRTAMINLPVFPVRTPEAFYEQLHRVEARPRNGQARSGQDEGVSRTPSRNRAGAEGHQGPAALIGVWQQHVPWPECVSLHQCGGRFHPGTLAADAGAAVRGGKHCPGDRRTRIICSTR